MPKRQPPKPRTLAEQRERDRNQAFALASFMAGAELPAIIKRIRAMLATDEVARKLEALLELGDLETLRKIDLALGKHAELVKKCREKIAKASAKRPPS
jgi:hypothetical protein